MAKTGHTITNRHDLFFISRLIDYLKKKVHLHIIYYLDGGQPPFWTRGGAGDNNNFGASKAAIGNSRYEFLVLCVNKHAEVQLENVVETVNKSFCPIKQV